MPRIVLTTHIQAPIERCFDLSRSIDLHKVSTAHTHEKAINGVTSGLIGLNEFVTWRAKHFGAYQKLTSKITEFERPVMFVDEMVQGAFKGFRHVHHFKSENAKTIITDIFDYKSPFGIFGQLADALVLKQYMTQLLEHRNGIIKDFAETDNWRKVLL